VTSPARNDNRLGATIELIRAYAKQETIGPLKGAGRWIGLGLAGALCWGLGVLFLGLGLLRALQTQTTVFHGNWSWAPYLITVVAVAIVMAIALSRIRTSTLQRRKEVPQ
jgi:hypothetical protein